MPVIGFLGNSSASYTAPYVVAFRQGPAEAGYVEGQNVVIEYRWVGGHQTRSKGPSTQSFNLYNRTRERGTKAAYRNGIQGRAFPGR
jgi:hypothetical protein